MMRRWVTWAKMTPQQNLVGELGQNVYALELDLGSLENSLSSLSPVSADC